MQAVFTLGFALASLYHICHMHEAGLSESSLLGVSGLVWRTFDILCAQWLLGRTFSHAIGASHWVTHGMHIQSTTSNSTIDIILLFGKHFVLCATTCQLTLLSALYTLSVCYHRHSVGNVCCSACQHSLPSCVPLLPLDCN